MLDGSASQSPMPPPPETSAPSPQPTGSTVTLGEPVLERLVFRELQVGASPHPGSRRTWTLTRGITRALLEVLCQDVLPEKESAARGVQLNGAENDESLWAPPTWAVYAGEQRSNIPLSYRLTAVSRRSTSMPEAIDLACRRASAAVLLAGAALVLDRRRPGDPSEHKPPLHWEPSASEAVTGLSCTATTGSDAGGSSLTLWPDVALLFAHGKDRSPGVEWAHESSDRVVHQGAYRWMPAR
jgi:hypothetical protein